MLHCNLEGSTCKIKYGSKFGISRNRKILNRGIRTNSLRKLISKYKFEEYGVNNKEIQGKNALQAECNTLSQEQDRNVKEIERGKRGGRNYIGNLMGQM